MNRLNLLFIPFVSLFVSFAAGASEAAPDPACELYLARSGQPLPVPPKLRAHSEPFLDLLRGVYAQSPLEPEIAGLERGRVVDLSRAGALIPRLKDPASDLNRQLEKHIQILGGMQSERLWDRYFQSYDKIVGFTDGFLDLAGVMNHLLPNAGTVADFGTGTGNVLALLALGHPTRHLIGLDFSRTGLESARLKMAALSATADLRFADLRSFHFAPASLDGAVMNNVLYTLGHHRLEVLRAIFAALKPGAPFILSDITDVVIHDGEKMTQSFTAAALQAIMRNAPVTEYDLALVAKINTMVLLDPSNPYLSLERLIDMVKQAGFEVRGYYSSYYGSAAFLHLVKPELPN